MTQLKARAEKLVLSIHADLPPREISNMGHLFPIWLAEFEKAFQLTRDEAIEEAAKRVDSYRVVDKYVGKYEAQSFLLNAASLIRALKSGDAR